MTTLQIVVLACLAFLGLGGLALCHYVSEALIELDRAQAECDEDGY